MSVLEIINLKFSYGEKELFNSLNLRLFKNDHLGLIGVNGAGKTTLMNLIARIIDPDEGRINWRDGITYSYLDQHLKVDKSLTIKNYLYKVYEDLFVMEKNMNDLYKELETAPVEKYDKILNSTSFIETSLEEKGFYMIKSRIGNVVNGLGINYDENQKLTNLSSGQRVKVFLAKMLLEERDVLLLDEPTNFLDASHVDWLTKYLQNYNKAFIVISHDNDFINKISNVIGDLNNKNVILYKGDYGAYVKQKEMQDNLYQKEFESQQKYIKKTEDFINKNIVRASTTKRAQSRRKSLEKIEVMEKPASHKKIKFQFPFSTSYNMDALVVKNLEIGYAKAILAPIDLKVKFGEKIVIVGKNGVGKTTFLNTILGKIPKISGHVNLNLLNKVVYYSQDYKGNMNMDAVRFIQEHYPLMEPVKIRTLLGKYGIGGELAIKSMDKLSGGELTKVRFAKLSLEKSNLLILDEPTNHLDKLAKEALYGAINEYPGTVILVSHEKEFYIKLNIKEIIFN
jgi:ATPase subunit of ABC transporter with duplicated ATPase domains